MHIVSKWTGVPLNRMEQKEAQKLLNMEEELKQQVIGQDEAVIASPFRFREFNSARNRRFTSLRKLESRLGPQPEENQAHFSQACRSNEGVFCSENRILLGQVAASLV